jgi:hypothetical protein
VEANELIDLDGTRWVILSDQAGNALRCNYASDDGVGFGWKAPFFHTKPGDAEELTMLRLLMEAFAKIYDPALDGVNKPTIPGSDSRGLKQDIVKRFIRVLEFRCTNKRARGPSDP